MTCCVHCGQPIDPRDRGVWRRVQGWERKAQGDTRKSGSDIVLREQRDEFACDGCIQVLKLGLSPQQGALI